MDELKCPAALGAAYWDKQKAALAKLKPTPVRAELEKLKRAYDVVDWTAFGTAKLDTVALAEKRLVDLDKEAKRTLKSLATQAEVVEKLAAKWSTDFGKDKQTPKEVLASLAAIEKAAKLLQSDIDVYIETARSDVNDVLAKLQAKEKKPAPLPTGKPKESKARKFVRTKALECIRKIKKPVPGSKPWRFIVVKGNPTILVCMLQTVPGGTHDKMLRSLIPAEKAQTFKDPKGEVIWEKNAITLVSDRLPTGLAKKMQIWLKALTKLNAKVRIRKTTGEVEESEEGADLSDDMLKADPAETAARAQAGKDFVKRLGGLAPEIKRALTGSMPAEMKAELKELIDSITKHGKAQEFEDADSDLDALETLLEEGDAAAAASPAGANGGSVKLAAARLDLVEQRKHAISEITRLAQTLVAEFRNEPAQQAQVKSAVAQFQALAAKLSPNLENQLDRALAAKDPAEQARLATAAKPALQQFQALLDKDPLMRELDGNELISDMKVVEPMKKSLSAVEAALG
jgi:hypothetical protein